MITAYDYTNIEALNLQLEMRDKHLESIRDLSEVGLFQVDMA